MRDYESTQNYLKDGYFAALDANCIIRHEMIHKRNWDKAKAEYRAYPNKYRNLDDAIAQLDLPVYSYTKIVVEPFSVFDVLEVFMGDVKWQR